MAVWPSFLELGAHTGVGLRCGREEKTWQAEDVRVGSWVVQRSKLEERSGVDEEKEESKHRWTDLTESAKRLKTYKDLFSCLRNSPRSEGLTHIPSFHQLSLCLFILFFCFLKQAYMHLQGIHVNEDSGEALSVCPAFAFCTYTHADTHTQNTTHSFPIKDYRERRPSPIVVSVPIFLNTPHHAVVVHHHFVSLPTGRDRQC